MTSDWTIDTNILYAAARQEWSAIELLNRIMRLSEFVALDDGREIQDQYARCLEKVRRHNREYPAFEFTELWFKHIVSKASLTVTSRISRQHKTRLKQYRCSPKDWVFIGVCMRTTSRRLVTHDHNDFNDETCAYLAETQAVSVLAIEEALGVDA